MIIPIDRQKKLTLLKWLKQGYIDAVELHSLQDTCPLTQDAIESELDRLVSSNECERLKRLGLCIEGGKAKQT